MQRAQARRQSATTATQAKAIAAPPVAIAAGADAPDPLDAAATATTAPATATEITRVGYAPIVRVDAARREIELCATSEAVDSYGTVFDYKASKAAFARWMGNVREMHERRAVGRRVAVRYDDEARRIYVRACISTGAQDTWEKISDGTLRGASIGARNVVWTFQTRPVAGRDQVVQVATAYDLVELSLVDNPSNPDALGITIVRAAEPVAALLAELDDPTADEGTEGSGPREGWPAAGDAGDAGDAEPREAPGERFGPRHDTTERARGPFSANAVGAPDMGVPNRAPEPPATETPAAGNARERFHAAARGILAGCGCAQCEAALATLAALDDTAGLATQRSDVERAAAREAALARAVAAGLAAEARQVERMETTLRLLETTLRDALGGISTTLNTTLGDLRARLERIEAQPLSGGPALRAVEKTHALVPGAPEALGATRASPAEQYRALEALAGKLSDPQAQIAVAAELIRLREQEGR
jgi:phage head maturation protease